MKTLIKADYRLVAELFCRVERVNANRGVIKKKPPAVSFFYYFLVCGLRKAFGLTGRAPLYWMAYITLFLWHFVVHKLAD